MVNRDVSNDETSLGVDKAAVLLLITEYFCFSSDRCGERDDGESSKPAPSGEGQDKFKIIGGNLERRDSDGKSAVVGGAEEENAVVDVANDDDVGNGKSLGFSLRTLDLLDAKNERGSEIIPPASPAYNCDNEFASSSKGVGEQDGEIEYDEFEENEE